MLAASQGQCSTHGFNQIHTLGKDIEGETETERNAERERAKEKKGEIVKQRGANIKTKLFFAYCMENLLSMTDGNCERCLKNSYFVFSSIHSHPPSV